MDSDFRARASLMDVFEMDKQRCYRSTSCALYSTRPASIFSDMEAMNWVLRDMLIWHAITFQMSVDKGPFVQV